MDHLIEKLLYPIFDWLDQHLPGRQLGIYTRTVDLAPGMYWFRDGKFEDGWLEWRPVGELFR